MIKTKQQYKATKDQIAKFEASIANLDAGRNLKPGIHPLHIKAHRDGLLSEIEVLQKQVDEYDKKHI